MLERRRAALAEWLAAASGARAVAIAEPSLLPGGAIQENWGFDAAFEGGPFAGRHRLVLRTDAGTGIPSSLGRSDEFAVLKAVSAAGVTVPEPLWACADRGVIGKPFFVMRRVEGGAQGREITADPARDAALPTVAARLAAELARLQAIRPPCPDLAFLPLVGAAGHIAAFRAYLDDHPQPRPVLEWATHWLETHIPETLPPVLCHRDFRTGNYMLDGTELTGILDWEFAGWGDPDEDIGWFCCKGWRFARLDREAGGIAGRAAFYRAYEAASGRHLDPARVHFWEVLANVRWAVIALQQSDRHLIGGARDLSTAIIGRRASECDLELLMLLDPGGMRALGTPTLPSPARGGGFSSLPSPASGGGFNSLPSPASGGGLGRGEDAGGFTTELRDVPGGAALLALGREWLLDALLPLVPPERHRELRLVATAMAIAEREALAGEGPARDIAARLARFYDCPASARGDALLRRLAGDLRAGAFAACEARARASRAILWRLTVIKLREGNPLFLAENGFGE